MRGERWGGAAIVDSVLKCCCLLLFVIALGDRGNIGQLQQRLPQSGRETAGRNAILVDHLSGTIEGWNGRIDLAAAAVGLVTFACDGVAI